MAEKRMFARSIIDSDVFLSMPLTTQALYFHLSMRADDEGFVDKAKSITKIVGANEDDLRLLLQRRYLLAFDSGVVVIKHWWIHNYIRKDRIQPTNYQEELSQITKKNNNSYTEISRCQSNVSQLSDKCPSNVSIDKIRVDKNSIDKSINTYAEEDYVYTFSCIDKIIKDGKPIKINSTYGLTQELINAYKDTYPNIDIIAELKKMDMWLKANGLKTKKGMPRFINGWLNRIRPEKIYSNSKPKKTVLDMMGEMIKEGTDGQNNRRNLIQDKSDNNKT